MVPGRGSRCLAPVVVVQRDLPVLVESVCLRHLERRSPLRRRRRVARLRHCWLSLFEGISLRDLGIVRHSKRKSTPGDCISSRPGAMAQMGSVGIRTSAAPRLLSEQPKWHNHPPYSSAP